MKLLQMILTMSPVDLFYFFMSIGSVPLIRKWFPRHVTSRVTSITLATLILVVGSIALVALIGSMLNIGASMIETSIIIILVIIVWLIFFAVYGKENDRKTHREPPTK